jgi:uncharacterized membrane protein (DUF373 family)
MAYVLIGLGVVLVVLGIALWWLCTRNDGEENL